MPLIIPSNSISDVGYEVDNSLRFDDGSSDYLNRTPASASNRKTWTFSAWVKLGTIVDTYRCIFSANNSANYGANGTYIWFRTDHKLQISIGSGIYNLITNALFRDPSAWYHVVVAFDTTQGTSSNRIKMYVNGVEQTYSSSSYPTLDYQARVNDTSPHTVGSRRYISIDSYFDGYISEVCLIDGQALDPTSFGEFDTNSGIWKPIDVSGLTFGTNGFYLDFENSGSLGADVSGNGNNFTVNNLTSIDQVTDTPTNNWCTLNPLNKQDLDLPLSSFSDGNTVVDYTSAGGISGNVYGTLGATQGKWYAEFNLSAYYGSSSLRCGFVKFPNGLITEKTVSATGTYMVAFDIDNSLYWTGTNGVWDAGDPSAGTGGTATGTIDDFVSIYVRDNSGSNGNGGKWEINTGNPPYTISSGNSDANGYGNFEYAVPSGYYALNTKNLAEYG